MKKSVLYFYSMILLFVAACSSPTPEFDDSLPEVKPVSAPVSVEANNLSPKMPAGNIAGLNPPHGEPGHDCNIAVGAPLNGSAVPENAPPSVNGTENPSTNSSADGVRLNPPHGQPGHDCNIPVGEPLS